MPLSEIPYVEFPSQSKKHRWYHITFHTYGAWLPGDPRGWRTRKHHRHVDGEYKNPPKEKEPGLLRHSQKALKTAPVVIPADLRAVIGTALVGRLLELDVFVLRMSVSGTHIHVLAKILRGTQRHVIGIAKNHAWHAARDEGWERKVWGKRGRELPVRDRVHQLNVYRYIGGHEEAGAWVWTWVKREEEVEGE